MAYVVSGSSGSWEIRESRITPKGPRSITLATFHTLTTKTVERARKRSKRKITESELVNAALRAGASVTTSPANDSARALLSVINSGHEPSPIYKRLLRYSLGSSEPALSDNVRSIGEWSSASLKRRGEALHDLLLLADSIPAAERPRKFLFPRIVSS